MTGPTVGQPKLDRAIEEMRLGGKTPWNFMLRRVLEAESGQILGETDGFYHCAVGASADRAYRGEGTSK